MRSSFDRPDGDDSKRAPVTLSEQLMGPHHTVSPVLLCLRGRFSVGGEEKLGGIPAARRDELRGNPASRFLSIDVPRSHSSPMRPRHERLHQPCRPRSAGRRGGAWQSRFGSTGRCRGGVAGAFWGVPKSRSRRPAWPPTPDAWRRGSSSTCASPCNVSEGDRRVPGGRGAGPAFRRYRSVHLFKMAASTAASLISTSLLAVNKVRRRSAARSRKWSRARPRSASSSSAL